jgi:hypothetical protein
MKTWQWVLIVVVAGVALGAWYKAPELKGAVGGESKG